MATVIRGRGGGGGSILSTIIVALIFGAGAGYGATWFAGQRSAPTPQDREFNVYPVVLQGVPGDSFSPDRIVVNKGDRVTINFHNTETVAEPHTFTMGSPYATDMEVTNGNNDTFGFTASTVGVFAYRCRFHQPTMTGYLVVLG